MKGRIYLNEFELSTSGKTYRIFVDCDVTSVKKDENGRSYIERDDAKSECIWFRVDSPMGMLIAAEKELEEEA